MKLIKTYLLGVFVIATSIGGYSQSKIDSLVFPKPSEKLIVLEQIVSSDDLIAAKTLSDSILYKGIVKEIDNSFFQSLLKLNQCSRNLSGNIDGPNVLLLSKSPGGFARNGISITKDNKTSNFPELNFVDLMLNYEDLRNGDFDIFSHELGHVMMKNIWNEFVNNPELFKSSKMHVSMGITDYYMAIYEGFGEHFQRLTIDNISKYQKMIQDRYGKFDYTPLLWHQFVDEELRLEGVLNNCFAFKKLLPQGVSLGNLSDNEKILLYHTSPLFDPTQLKNAQQMLSCEGFMATFFYKINTNKILQNNFREEAFYNNFLLSPIPDGYETSDIFTPFENIYLKHFWVWKLLNKMDLQGKVPIIEYLKIWNEEFPDDQEELTKIFIEITKGKTINNDLGEMYEKLSFYGIMGDYQNYSIQRKQYKQTLDTLIDKVLAGEIHIDKNVGPELWVKNPDMKINRVLWSDKNKDTLYVNLNTANEFELASFQGVNNEQARKILLKRKEMGYFTSKDQLKQLNLILDNPDIK
ncbi:MAG: ComEA family DNA-binding protein [Bacteroidota bacterium]